MRIPPPDLVYLRDQFSELATQIQEHWETASPSEDPADGPHLLGEAMAQLIDMLGLAGDPNAAPDANQNEVTTFAEYGLHLVDELAGAAHSLQQTRLARDVECLALPLALWLARNDAELHNLSSVVNAVAVYANRASDPQDMATLYNHCCELIEAASPACEEMRLSDGRQPWRLLMLNRAIVATRSYNLELMASAFDAIVEQLPDEAHRFFAEGMEQMAITDYPDPVRDMMQRYYVANAVPRRLH